MARSPHERKTYVFHSILVRHLCGGRTDCCEVLMKTSEYVNRKYKEYYAKRRASGICIRCKNPVSTSNNIYCAEHLQTSRDEAKQYKLNLRDLVYDHYGNQCNCCGENNPLFLTLDHINNDGAEHKRQLKTRDTYRIFRWVVKNNYPDNLQLLCSNCNTGKARNNGVCPHKGARK